MASTDLINAFNDCVERLRAGQSIEDCLRVYPHYAAFLRPMLEAGLAVRRAAPAVSPAAKARVRARVMPARQTSWWSNRVTLLAASFLAVLFVVALLVYANRDENSLGTESIPTVGITATFTTSPSLTPAESPTSTATETPLTPTLTPTLTPSPTPVCRFRVTASSANLRQGPGTGYTAVGFALTGDEFTVLASHTSHAWFEIATEDGNAWVAASVGELTGGCSGLTVSDAPLIAGETTEGTSPTQAPSSVPAPPPGDDGDDDGSDDGGHDGSDNSGPGGGDDG